MQKHCETHRVAKLPIIGAVAPALYNNKSKSSMGKSGALPVFLFTSAAIAISYITYLQFKKKDSRCNDHDEEENGWSPTENNVQPGSTSDVDTSIAATPQIKPIKQPHDANIDVLDLTPKSANTSQPTQIDTAATNATKNSITPSPSTSTIEANKEKKKKKIRPKIKPIITPQESDNVEASSSDSNTATSSSKDSEEEAQGREVSIRTELGFGEFAHSPPRSRSTSKKSLKSSGSQTGSNNDEDETPKEGANYTEISKYWKSQSTKNKFKAPEKSDAAIRVGSVADSSGSSSNSSGGVTATVTDDADVHVSPEDVEETTAEKSPETTQVSEKEEVAASTPEQPSTEADRKEKDEEGGEVKAEEVGTAESTLGASSQAKKEVSKEKATETLEQQSREEKALEKTNNTVAEVQQSMPQDSEDVEEEETQKEVDEEEDSQLIVPAASVSWILKKLDRSGSHKSRNCSVESIFAYLLFVLALV